jgi:hypothetical protein
MLIDLLDERDYTVQRIARDAPGAIGPPAVVSLLPLLDDAKDRIRRQVAGLLGDIGDLRALRPLLRRLWRERDNEVWGDMVRAIARLGDVRAVDKLLPWLTVGGYRIREKIVDGLMVMGESGLRRVRELADGSDGSLADLAQNALEAIDREHAAREHRRAQAAAGIQPDIPSLSIPTDIPDVMPPEGWSPEIDDIPDIDIVEIDDEDTDSPAADVPVTERGIFPDGDASERDDVDCSLFAPPQVEAGQWLLLQVFAHLHEDAREARAMAVEFDPHATRRGLLGLGTEVAHGSVLTFRLKLAGFGDDPPERSLTWRGRTESVEFPVHVPESSQPGTALGTLHIIQDGSPIGRVDFQIEIVPRGAGWEAAPEPIGTPHRNKFAFISYASEDGPEVLRRVQMLPYSGISFFQDCLSLSPGTRWEKELYRNIDKNDLMFLFWSASAKEPTWVGNEWRYALDTKGDDFIWPVIIEYPPCAPPDELKHLHFDDSILRATASTLPVDTVHVSAGTPPRVSKVNMDECTHGSVHPCDGVVTVYPGPEGIASWTHAWRTS